MTGYDASQRPIGTLLERRLAEMSIILGSEIRILADENVPYGGILRRTPTLHGSLQIGYFVNLDENGPKGEQVQIAKEDRMLAVAYVGKDTHGKVRVKVDHAKLGYLREERKSHPLLTWNGFDEKQVDPDKLMTTLVELLQEEWKSCN